MLGVIKILLIFSTIQGITSDLPWDEYLDGVYDLLGSYHFQKNRLLYNVQDLNDWSYGSSKQGLVINKDNLNEFVKLMEDHDLTYEITGDSSDEIEDLNYVIEATIGNELEITVDNEANRATVGGHFFKATEFKKEALDLITNFDSIDVFVVNSMFMDANVVLQLASTSSVNVIATNWYVQHYSWNILDFLHSANLFIGFGEKFIREKEMIDTEIGEKNCSNVILTFSATATSERTEIYWPQGSIKADSVIDRIIPIEDLNSAIIPDCHNTSNIETSKDTRKKGEAFERYRRFLIANYLKNRFLARKLSEILSKTNEDMTTSDAYASDPYKPLLDEFIYIENNVFDKDVDPIFLYKLLLEKSADVTRDALNRNTPLQNQKVLFQLYSAILGRICNLERDAEIYLVTDLIGYVEIITDHIENVKEKGKNVIIDGAVDTYSNELDTQIDQVKDLISTEIQPVIEDTAQQVNEEVGGLLDDIEELINDIKHDEDTLNREKDKLKDSLRNSIIFDVFKGIADIASTFFPPAELAGSLIDIGKNAFVPDVSIDDAAGKYDIPQMTNDSAKILDGLAKANSTCQMGHNVTQKLALDIFNKLADLGSSIYSDYQNYEQKMDIINDQIEQLEADINKLHEMKTQICETLGPVLGKITADITNLQDALVGESEASLEIEKWKIQSSLGKIQNYLDTYFEQFKSTQMISELIRQLSSAVSTLITMFDIIQNYNEHKKWGQVMDQIQTADFDNIDIPADLGMDFDKLELYINSNMVLLEFKHFADAVKQYAFPIADAYFKRYNILAAMQMNINTVELVTQQTIAVINDIKTNLGQDKDVISDIDKLKFSNTIFASGGFMKPYFVWRDSDFRDSLTSLLKGEEVTLTSDIYKSVPGANAIKFKVAELKFRPRDSKFTQEDVDELMDNFRVTTVHSGNSYYKCNNKTFVIGSHNQVISYSFKRDASGDPGTANDVYKKLKEGDYILSPYTTWKVQLSPSDSTGFDSLQDLIGSVDLELFGNGQYYTEDEELCNNYNVEKYYTQIDADISKTKSQRRLQRAVDVPSTLTTNAKGDIIIF